MSLGYKQQVRNFTFIIVGITVLIAGYTLYKQQALHQELYLIAEKTLMDDSKTNLKKEVDRFETFLKLRLDNAPIQSDAETEFVLRKMQTIYNKYPVINRTDSYVFVYSDVKLDQPEAFAKMFINPNRPDLIGKTVSAFEEDGNGVAYRLEALKQMQVSGDAFVRYVYLNPSTKQVEEKISYFKYNPELDLIMAKGEYHSSIQSKLARLSEVFNKEYRRSIIEYLLFISLILGSAMLISLRNAKAVEKKVVEWSEFDHLTHILNRLGIDAELNNRIANQSSSDEALSLIMFDIDNFKLVNDQYGHLVGDDVLQKIALVVSKRLRKSDTFGRWGGEEFLVLTNDDPKEAKLLAERLRASIEQADFGLADKVTCSFGLAGYEKGDSNESLTNKADEALYFSKQHGKNKVTQWLIN